MTRNKGSGRKPSLEPKLQAVSEPTEPRGYTLGQWAGLPQYRCKSCQYDCLDLDMMLDHLVQRHSPVADIPDVEQPTPLQPAPIQPEAILQPGEAAQDIYEIDLKEDQDGR